MQESLWLIINTLEAVTIVSTEDNLSKMLGAIRTLKQIAHNLDEQEVHDG